MRRRSPSNPATEVAHNVLPFAAGAMRSKLPSSPLLAWDVPRGEAIVLAEVASVEATIHAGTIEHLHVAESTDNDTIHRLAELGRTGQAGYPEAG